MSNVRPHVYHRYLVRHLIVLKALLVALVGVAPLACCAGAWVAQPDGHQDEPLCQELEHRLHSYRWTNPDAYWGVVVTDPRLREPSWEDLVPEENMALLQKLTWYRQRGATSYFSLTKPPKYPSTADVFYRTIVAPEVAQGARLQIWRARVNDVYDMGRRVAPLGEQTILQWRTPHDVNMLKRDPRWRHKPLPTWQGAVFFVQSDLSGPDPNVDVATAAFASSSSLLLFEGTPYLFDSAGMVFQFDPNRGLEPYCFFVFREERVKR